ncbi:MAG: hypothetical protein EOP83_16450, partial [Verrucomicrobiaceae bacterium]
AHEILHCIYDHLGRRGGRDPKLLNMAQDYVINYTLVEDKTRRHVAEERLVEEKLDPCRYD